MDRTAEFRQYLLSQPPRAARRQPARPAPAAAQFAELADDARDRIASSRALLAQLRENVAASASFGREEWAINALIQELQGELSAVDQRIRDLDQSLRCGLPAPRNAPLVLQALREALSAVGAEFRAAVQGRAATLEEYRRRRRPICAPPGAPPPPAVFHEDAGAAREAQAALAVGRDRLDAVRSVEGSVARVAQMFAQLSELIEAQHYDVVRIDEDADAALSHMESAQRQLAKYADRLRKCFGLKVAAVLLVFVLLFLIVA
jgi:hypothetical protein